jgi:hypothetical protein
MDIYTLIATISLLIQLTVLVLLVTSYMLKRREKFRLHGILMLSAVIVHAAMVFWLMIPSFNAIVVTAGLSSFSVTTAMFHAPFGIISLILGIWVVGSWRLRKSIAFCAPKKRIMLFTFITWIIAITLGVILYLSLYFPALISG